jgi:hypothetical protein
VRFVFLTRMRAEIICPADRCIFPTSLDTHQNAPWTARIGFNGRKVADTFPTPPNVSKGNYWDDCPEFFVLSELWPTLPFDERSVRQVKPGAFSG